MQVAKIQPAVSIMHRRRSAFMDTRGSVLLLVSILLISSAGNAALAASSKDADLTINIDISKRVLMSDESLQAVFSLGGLSNTDTYILSWNLREGNSTQGISLASDSFYFQPSGSSQFEAIEVWHFSTDAHLYHLSASLEKAGDPTSMESTFERFAVFRNVIAPDWDDLILFGDSLSDTGSAYRDWGTPDSPPYFNGRFTNGQVWLEYVHDSIGVSTTNAQGSNAGNNRGYGGATTENGYYLWVITNVGQQVDDYTDTFSFDSDEAVAILGGGNDLRNGVDDGQDIVDNIQEHAVQVIGEGAETLLLFQVPPIDRIPEFRDDSDEEKAELAERVDEFNEGIASLATTLANQYGITVHLIPLWDSFEEIYWNPDAFGFDNVTHSACEHTGFTCDSNDPIDPVPNRFIFFDNKHPTAPVHRYISYLVGEVVGDSDYDGDGIADDEDDCDDSRPDEEIDEFGCPLPADSDEDGVLDEDDDCPNTQSGESVDASGCSASQRDTDEDGINDADDLCPGTAAGASVNSQGCSSMQLDFDLDGVVNGLDHCDQTLPGAQVDENGCSAEQRDSDADGVFDAWDQCPMTAAGEEVDADGCAAYQRDSDADGVADAFDECDGTDEDEEADETGCGPSQRDSDGDGHVDSDDECPETPSDEEADRHGCGPSQRDTDEDGLNDSTDPCPETAGTIGGCPEVTVELELLNEMTNPGMARIAMTLTCDDGCKAKVVVDGTEYGRLAEGTHLLMVNVVDGQTVVVNASFGTSYQIAELTIIFSDPSTEPEPEPGPEPSPEPEATPEVVPRFRIIAGAAVATLLVIIAAFALKKRSTGD